VSQKTHPRAVGAFVLGAIALVLGAIVLLSSGNWFEPKSRFTVFFPGSVRGLNKGAPVTFRGVRIGEVKEVTAFLTGREDPLIQIEAVIEVRTNVVESPAGMARPFDGMTPAELAAALIARGARARLLSQSLLTGQKYIDLDFLPEEPARLAGIERLHPELPTTRNWPSCRSTRCWRTCAARCRACARFWRRVSSRARSPARSAPRAASSRRSRTRGLRSRTHAP
jgi:paraquat-inducible protein B